MGAPPPWNAVVVVVDPPAAVVVVDAGVAVVVVVVAVASTSTAEPAVTGKSGPSMSLAHVTPTSLTNGVAEVALADTVPVTVKLAEPTGIEAVVQLSPEQAQVPTPEA